MKNKDNKILIITPKFYPSIWWIEEQVKLLWENFLEKWYEVDILTSKFDNKLEDKEKIFWFNIYRFSSIFSYISFLIKNWNNCDLILSRQYYKNSFLLWLLKFLKLIKTKAVIIWDWWTKKNEITILQEKLGLFSRLYFYILSKNNYFIANNSYFVQSLREIFNKDFVKKIYNGIKLKDYKYPAKKEIINILYLSRFDKWKWYIETIEAFKKIKNDNIKLHLIWYWDKKIENQIKEIIKKDKRIIYHWKLYWQDKEDIIKKTDLFVFPTYYEWESFWMVLYEIALYNIPIISTNFWDTKQIYWNNILYVKEKNVEDLKNKIEWIVNNIWSYNYDYTEALNKVDINTITKKILELK